MGCDTCPHSTLKKSISLADNCFTIESGNWVDSDNEDRYRNATISFACYLDLTLSQDEKEYLSRDFGRMNRSDFVATAEVIFNTIHTIRALHLPNGQRINDAEKLSIDELYLFANSELHEIELRTNFPPNP